MNSCLLSLYFIFTVVKTTSIYNITIIWIGASPQEVDPSGSYSGRKRRQSIDDYDYEQTEIGKDDSFNFYIDYIYQFNYFIFLYIF